MRLIIRNDDIDFRYSIDDIKKCLNVSDYYQQSFSIIPFGFDEKSICSIWDYTIWKFIVDNGLSYSLHGLFHKNYKNCYEFLYHDKEYERLCVDYFEIIKVSPFETNIFVPPHNFMNFNWETILKKYNYTIISNSKRQFQINDLICKSGTISINGMFYIPQTLMLRRDDFYSIESYFDSIFEAIQFNSKKLCNLVITIHGYEILEDQNYFIELKKFLRKLEQIGVKTSSFNDYKDNDEYEIEYDIFYKYMKNERKKYNYEIKNII